METRIYHGNISSSDLSEVLLGRFNRGNLVARQTRIDGQTVVQIASRQYSQSGGTTALGVTIQDHEDGIVVHLGKQAWLGIAASLGATLLAVRSNPLNLLSRLDDIAQDIENLHLDEQVWQAIEETMRAFGASRDISTRLRRTACAYCATGNPVGSPRCLACGAPLGDSQPTACENCGFVLAGDEAECPNCGQPVQ
ncbi:MAG: zinc ribbon domain-containing protein [Chloroflexi bacterium]|nr:zinc ribbon domain-containing protein [Chloroflexota bacterium]